MRYDISKVKVSGLYMSKINLSKYIFGCIIVLHFIVLILLLFTSIHIDQIISHYMRELKYTLLYHFAFWVTKLGSSSFLVPFTIVVMFVFIIIFNQLKQAFTIASMTLFSYALNEGIKYCIKRDRPSIFIEAHAIGYSYPSGHAMITVVFYGLLFYFFAKKINHQLIKIMFASCIILVIIIIGL